MTVGAISLNMHDSLLLQFQLMNLAGLWPLQKKQSTIPSPIPLDIQSAWTYQSHSGPLISDAHADLEWIAPFLYHNVKISFVASLTPTCDSEQNPSGMPSLTPFIYIYNICLITTHLISIFTVNDMYYHCLSAIPLQLLLVFTSLYNIRNLLTLFCAILPVAVKLS